MDFIIANQYRSHNQVHSQGVHSTFWQMPLPPIDSLSDDEPATGAKSEPQPQPSQKSERKRKAGQTLDVSKVRLALTQILSSTCLCVRSRRKSSSTTYTKGPYAKPTPGSCFSKFRGNEQVLKQLTAMRCELHRLHKQDADEKVLLVGFPLYLFDHCICL